MQRKAQRSRFLECVSAAITSLWLNVGTSLTTRPSTIALQPVRVADRRDDRQVYVRRRQMQRDHWLD